MKALAADARSQGIAMRKTHHIVLLRFRPTTTEVSIAQLYRELDDLRGSIPGILHYCHGPYSSPEGLNQGLTHGFIMTFADTAARDGYLSHPDHERVKARVLPGVQKVVVFDFEE
jgi:hypothetical protein